MADQRLHPYILQLARGSGVNSPLSKYARDVTSQCGEDGIIEHIVSALSLNSKFCVEFGAWDGKLYSNTYNLITNLGWSACLIEASAEKFPELEQEYAARSDVITLNEFIEFDGENTLDNILARHNVPQEIGLISIDIDGNDYHVWESLTAYTPEVVVIEFNPTVPNDVIFVQAKSFDVSQGCSLLALIRLAKKKGYQLVCCANWNAFFVKNEHFQKLGVKDNSIYTLYEPVMDGRIFHGYDATIHVTGMPSFLWGQEGDLSSERFQIIPSEQRVYSDHITPED